MTLSRPTLARSPQEAPRWHLRLLGDVVLTDMRGRVHRLPGRTATTLLARLALAPERAHAREALVELLWPGVALDVGRNRLRQALSTLKQLLDGAPPATPDGAAGVLQAERLTLRLRPGALVCDAWRFEQALRAGALSEAAALYRGELLPGVYDDWVHEERQRLQALADGLPAGLPPPLPQPAPAAPATAAAAAAPAALNLPHYLTRVYGTEHSARQLLQAVRTRRLVTLLGPGGHGKTRLAVELAHALATAPLEAAPPDAAQPPPFDLVVFVPLVAARDPDAVLMALLLALRQDSRGADPLDPFDRLASLLDGRRSLLVLDNLEQLVDSCAVLVATLLARCPGLHLLVTSRRVLGLDGEHLHPLPPLPLPLPSDDPAGDDAEAAVQAMAANPATALFVDRARAARPDFALDREQAIAVRALVCHLQGMPLAIELAAAQVRSIDPATLLGLLQADAPQAAPGLALLARSGPRAGADPRHASMLAVVQWSWNLLSAPAQALLPRLSCLAASFTLGAAQALANAPATEVAQVLDELVSHSMLHSTDGGRRYALFELIREFAASRLDPAAAPGLRQRHRQWLTGWFAALPLSAPLRQVRAEVPNLAAAFRGADLDGADADAAALAAAAQTALSTISLPPQALAALQRCVDRLRDPVARAVGRAGLARSLLVNGQAHSAGRLADAALAELPSAPAAGDSDPNPARAQVLARVAHVRWRLHRDPAAAGWLAEALALARSAGALALQATILTNQGAVLRPRQPQAAIALQREAVALWARAGDRHGVNVGRCNLATALLAQRAGCAEALALLQQAVDDTHAAGDDLQHALACNLQGEAWSRLCRWDDAAQAYRACIATAWAAAEPWPLAYGLWNLPRALAHLRQPQRAARLMGFAEGHVPTVTGPLTRADRHDLRRLQRLSCCQADADTVLRWWAEGRALRLPLAVGEALQR